MSAQLDALLALIRKHPLAALAVSNTLVAAAGVYAVSEGRPLHFLWKQLFRAALAAVPASVVKGELDKVGHSIEVQVIGSSLQGETTYRVLPAEGLPRAAVMDCLERYSAKDKLKWDSGRVRACVCASMPHCPRWAQGPSPTLTLTSHPPCSPSWALTCRPSTPTSDLWRSVPRRAGAGGHCL